MVLQQKESVEGMTGQKKNLWNHYKNDYKCEDECSEVLEVLLCSPTRFCLYISLCGSFRFSNAAASKGYQ